MTAVETSTLKSAHAAVVRFVNGVPYVLIVQRQDKPSWEFPGGAPENGETQSSYVAARELQEETGINPTGAHIATRDIPSKKFEGRHYGVSVIYWEFDEPRLELDPEEVRDARWQPLDNIHGLIPFQEVTFLPVVQELVASRFWETPPF